jgi:YidC/Oxa1 family membrane protein insertase
MEAISWLFNTFLIYPLTNLFVLFSTLTGSAGMGVILLTIFIRAVTLPMNLKQMRMTRMMAALAPRIQDIQKRYKDPKRRSEEQMKLYREAGFNPVGCFGSFLVQFPILIALYQVFTLAVGEAPEALIKVSSRLYPWDYLRSNMPLNADFLWLHLGRPDPIVLPILVAGTTYVLQKMSALPAMDERQRQQNSMMNLMMPLIFGYITFSLPSGLGLYYVLSNIIGMVLQYAYVGGGPFNWRALLGLSQEAVLPRALEVRQAQFDSVGQIGRGEADEEPEAPRRNGRRGGQSAAPQSNDGTKSKPPAGDGARPRRRYSSGRRRGRR